LLLAFGLSRSFLGYLWVISCPFLLRFLVFCGILWVFVGWVAAGVRCSGPLARVLPAFGLGGLSPARAPGVLAWALLFSLVGRSLARALFCLFCPGGCSLRRRLLWRFRPLRRVLCSRRASCPCFSPRPRLLPRRRSLPVGRLSVASSRSVGCPCSASARLSVSVFPCGRGVSAVGASPSLASSRSVAFSAFRAGSLASVACGPASRSGSSRARVCCLGFRRFSSASAFALRWSSRLACGVVVRRAGALWAVSVPVGGISSGWLVGLPVRGGLRGLLRALVLLRCASPARVRAFGGVVSWRGG